VRDGTEVYVSLRNCAEGNLVAEDKATQREEGVTGKPGRVGNFHSYQKRSDLVAWRKTNLLSTLGVVAPRPEGCSNPLAVSWRVFFNSSL